MDGLITMGGMRIGAHELRTHAVCRVDCVDEVKFPLGIWKENETRMFDVSCNNGTLRRRIELTIEKLDFNYDGVPHSLQFHWVADGGKGRGTDMRYVYSPGRGLASVDED